MKQRKFIAAVIATLIAGQALALDVASSNQLSNEVGRALLPSACSLIKSENLRAHIVADDQDAIDQTTTALRVYVAPANITSAIDPAVKNKVVVDMTTTVIDSACPDIDEVAATTPKVIELQHEYVDSFRQIPDITPAGFLHRRVAGSFFRYAAPTLAEGVTATITAKDDAEADQVVELYRRYGAKATFERVIDPAAELVTIKINQGA